jgi:Spy/CpxP family protein refolding chaperone
MNFLLLILSRPVRLLGCATLLSLAQAALVAAQAAPVAAQDSSAKSEGGARLEAMREKLGLTEEQLAKIKPALEEQASRLKAIKEDGSLSEEQKREKARGESGELRKVMGEVLNPDQKVKLAEMMKERAGDKPGPAVEQRLRGMKEKLGLSDEQAAKIRPILEEEAPKLRDASPDQRREMIRESFGRIAAELTPEQREKMKEQFKAKKN